jgi:hypothetical protein
MVLIPGRNLQTPVLGEFKLGLLCFRFEGRSVRDPVDSMASTTIHTGLHSRETGVRPAF